MSDIVAPAPSARRGRGWPLRRILFTLAGSVTLTSAVLAAVVSPWFLLLTAFVGANQLLFAATGACPASLILTRYLGVKEGCR